MIAAAWNARTSREKLLIGAAGGLVLVIVVTQVLIAPVLGAHASAKSTYERALADWAAVQDALTRLGGGGAPADEAQASASLRAVISNSAAQNELTLARVQPSGDGALSVSLEDAEATTLFRWLRVLRDRHGVHVQRASVRRSDRNAVVRATLVLSSEAPR